MKRVLLFTLLLCLVAVRLAGQTSTDKCTRSTEGKEFWLGFMESRHHQAGHYLELTFTSSMTCHFSLYIGKSTVAYYSGTLQPNTPVLYQPAWSMVEPIGSETIESKAIHVVSDNPMNIFAMNWSPNSADAAVIFPVDALGSEYYAVCYEPNINEGAGGAPGNGKNSEFVIVASEDNTKVTITPSKVTDLLKPANVPFVITLNKGELYQVQSMNHANLAGQGDLTGSYISSDKPIAFYSGCWSTTIPIGANSAWDHLYEQIPPIRSWGRKFVTVPLKGRTIDVFRIVASENQTKIRIGNGNTILLDKGKFYEFQLTSDKPSLIESDHPVLLAQYMVSNVVDRPPGVSQSDWDGDPLMLIVSPVDQTREAVTFVAYDSPNIVRKFFVNIVTKYTSMNDILLDGMPVTFEYLNGTDYSIAQVPITKGNHNLNSTKAGSGFIAYVYGYGGVESYGYGVGFNLSIKLDLGGDIHFVSDTLLLCKGEAKILDGGSAFSKFRWSTGDTTRTIFVTKPGYVSLTASNAEGCEITDSIYNYVSAPEVHLGNDTTLCKPATILLDAGKGFIGYKWSTGDSIQKITVKQAGYYSVLTTDKYDCPARDTLWTGFVDKPKPDLSHLDTLVCGKKTALFNLSADKGLYSLSSTDNSIKIDQLTATVPAYGSYPFRFNMVDQYQCKSDTAFRVAFRKIPTVTISVDDTTCYGYNLEARYLGDATIDKSRFTWVFAKDTLTDEIGKILMKIKLGMDRSKRDLFLKVTEDGCSNQNAIKEISVIPDLDFSVADSLQCQPKTFHFLATNTETVVDYLWNWGDGSTEHNGNQAVHNYAQDGHYTVELTATTDKHCENTVRKANVLYVAPVPTVDFSIKENSCLPKGIQNLFYTGSADSRDHYYWDISAFQPNEITNNPGDSKGPFSFRFIDNPIRKIGLQVISKYGCVSENKSLILRRIPNFSFASSDSAGCIPFSPELKAVPLDKLDKLSYHWNFGNGTSDNGTNVTPTFPLPDKLYDLTLTAASTLTGCSDSLRETGYFTIYPQPTAGFSVDKTLLSNESPTIQLTNTSDGAEQYRWDFADGYISRLKDPVHTFKVVGPRRIHLDAINTFGCVDTTSTEVQIALGKIFTPNAFSPNAQNQEDRIFFPYCNGVIEQGYHLRILSRWNDLVFETSNQLKGWTGKMPDGSNAPAGNYVWLLNFTDFLGVLHKQSGTVTLLY